MNYISHLMDDKSMKKLVSQTGMGIESIEFSISENLDHLEQKLVEYEKRLEQLEVPALTVHGPFLDLNPMAFDSLIQQATRTRYEQAYEAARKLGAQKMIFHAGFIPSVYFLEGWAERMADFYNRFLEDKPEKIQILMENVLDPYPEPLKEVADRIQHPAFGICLDVGHAHCYSDVSVEQWIQTLEPYIKHLHLHDNCGMHDSHLAVGDGSVPMESIGWLIHQGMEYTLECRSEEDVLYSLHSLEVCKN